MIKLAIAAGAVVLGMSISIIGATSASAQAHTGSAAPSPNMVAHMFPAPPSAEQLAIHKLYIQNLKDAGLYKELNGYWGQVNMTPHMFPDHSKVARTARYVPTPGRRDPSAGY